MGYYYSDPTASTALGNINREFSRLEKKAKMLRKRMEAGQLSPEELERVQQQFKGRFKNVLNNVLEEEPE